MHLRRQQFVVFMYEKNSAVTTLNAARQKLFSQRCKAINTYISTEHQGCHLHLPGAGPRTTMETTMDNASSGWGLVLRAYALWLQARLWNKMQVCSCQLPMYCLMLLWRRLICRLAWWQHLNLPADFVWVVATSFLFRLWIYSVLSEHWIATSELIVCRFCEGSIKTHISPLHTSTARP